MTDIPSVRPAVFNIVVHAVGQTRSAFYVSFPVRRWIMQQRQVRDLMRIRHGHVVAESATLREVAERLIVSDCDCELCRMLCCRPPPCLRRTCSPPSPALSSSTRWRLSPSSWRTRGQCYSIYSRTFIAVFRIRVLFSGSGSDFFPESGSAKNSDSDPRKKTSKNCKYK